MEINYLSELTKNLNEPFENDDFDGNYGNDLEVINEDEELLNSISVDTIDTSDFINRIQSKVSLKEEKIQAFEKEDKRIHSKSNQTIDGLLREQIKNIIEEEFMPLIKKMVEEQVKVNKIRASQLR